MSTLFAPRRADLGPATAEGAPQQRSSGPTGARGPEAAAALTRSQAFQRGREAASLLLFVASVFSALALLSFVGSPKDADLAGADWVGPVGASWARFLVSAIGIASWVVPAELLLLTWPLLRNRASIATVARLAGDFLVVLICAALVQVALPAATGFGAMPAAGNLGELFGELLRSLFSNVGSFLLGLTAIALILIGRASFSFIAWADRATRGTEVAASRAKVGALAVAEAWERAADLRKQREQDSRARGPRIHGPGDPAPGEGALALALTRDLETPPPPVVLHVQGALPKSQTPGPLLVDDTPRSAQRRGGAQRRAPSPPSPASPASTPTSETPDAPPSVHGAPALPAGPVADEREASAAQDAAARPRRRARKDPDGPADDAETAAPVPPLSAEPRRRGRKEEAKSPPPPEVHVAIHEPEPASLREPRALAEPPGPAFAPSELAPAPPPREDDSERDDPAPRKARREPVDAPAAAPASPPRPSPPRPSPPRPSLPSLPQHAPEEAPPARALTVSDRASEPAPSPAEAAAPEVSRLEPAVHKPVAAAQPLPAARPPAPPPRSAFRLPGADLLDPPRASAPREDPDALRARAKELEKVLANYGVKGTVADIHTGPTVSTFEVVPAEGTKVRQVAGLDDDLALGLSCKVRIVAPIPGKSRIGFELPNRDRIPVNLRELVEDRRFTEMTAPLPVVLGRDIVGAPFYGDLASMPHVIVAGATGAGKSVGLNVMLVSLLMRRTPEELRLLMIDPKVVELAPFDKIPHLLLPVVTDMKLASNALKWAVDEMERRYQLFANAGTKNIGTFNGWVERVLRGEVKSYAQPKAQTAITEDGSEVEVGPERPAPVMPEKLPWIVIVVDEFADLIMQQGKDVEAAVARLAQKARAAGMHVILATQRPSTDVITGTIKSNFPSRVAFRVVQWQDSKTILDEKGAEQLLGRGDMLVKLNGMSDTRRVQCPFIEEEEVQRVTDFLRAQGEPVYDETIIRSRDDDDSGAEEDDGELDLKYDEAVRVVAETQKCSTSWLQRKLGVGYNRAAKIVEALEKRGVVGPAHGVKDREVLIGPL